MRLTVDGFLIEAVFEQIFPRRLFYDRASSKEGLFRSFSLSVLCVTCPLSVFLPMPNQTQHVSWSCRCPQDFGQHLSAEKAIFFFLSLHSQFNNSFLFHLAFKPLPSCLKYPPTLCTLPKRHGHLSESSSLHVCLFFV